MEHKGSKKCQKMDWKVHKAMCKAAHKEKKQAKAKKKAQRKGLKPVITPLTRKEQKMADKIGRAVSRNPINHMFLVFRRMGYTRADNPGCLAILMCCPDSTNPAPRREAFAASQMCFAPRLTYTFKEALAALSDPNLV